jgi:hypothetical protein
MWYLNIRMAFMDVFNVLFLRIFNFIFMILIKYVHTALLAPPRGVHLTHYGRENNFLHGNTAAV